MSEVIPSREVGAAMKMGSIGGGVVLTDNDPFYPTTTTIF
jgi:hypothetical protein